MSRPISILLDFETLDTSPSAVVTQIGALAIHRGHFAAIDDSATAADSLDTTVRIDLDLPIFPQLAAGRSFSTDTLAWHTSKRTRTQCTTGTPPDRAARILRDFIEDHKPHRVWAWGKDFERPLLENFTSFHGVHISPFSFKRFACARDRWQDAFGLEAKAPDRTHIAIEDCLAELRDLHAALAAINLLHVF